jgi:hypothetical protein
MYPDPFIFQPPCTGNIKTGNEESPNAFAQWPTAQSPTMYQNGPCRRRRRQAGAAALPKLPDPLIAGIDWKVALGPITDHPDAVYYDGLILRNAIGKPLTKVTEDLEKRISGLLQARRITGDAGSTDYAGLARQIRRTMTADPTLSMHPPPDINYGSPRWVALWTGMRTLAELGLPVDKREAHDLVALGRAAIRTRARRNAVKGPGYVTRGVDLGGLLLIAHAAGRIDLGGLAQGDSTITPDQLTSFCQEACANDLRIVDLLSELANFRLPTGEELRLAKSRAAGIGPDPQIDPDALRVEFDAAFDLQLAAMAQYVAAIIDVSISRYSKFHGIDATNAPVTVALAQRRIMRDAPPNSSARTVPQHENSVGYFISIDTRAGKHSYFLALDTGTELPLPQGVSIEDWTGRHGAVVFSPHRKQPESADHPWQPATCTLKELASGIREELAGGIRAAFPATLEHYRAAAFGWQTKQASDVEHDLVPFGLGHRAIRGGRPYDISLAAALDVLTLVPAVGTGVLQGSSATYALTGELDRTFAQAGRDNVLQAIKNAVTDPTDMLGRLRGGGQLSAKGVRAVAQRLHLARPTLAKELSDTVMNDKAAEDLDLEVPEDTPNYRGTYDESDAYAWSDDGEYQYTGFVADTRTVSMAEDVLHDATDLTHYAWWKDGFDQFFDVQVVNLEESAYVEADRGLADVLAAASQKTAMQNQLRAFLANVYTKSETFRRLANKAKSSGRIAPYNKWAIHIAAPEQMSGGRSEYLEQWARVDYASRTLTVPDIQAPPEGMEASTLVDGGTFTPNAPSAVIIHEMVHALTGISDPPVEHWENNAAALTQEFPERGVVDYLAQRILKESGIQAPRRLCYLYFGPEHRDVLRRRVTSASLKALGRYIDMQDAYLSKVFPYRNPAAAPWDPSSGNERWMNYKPNPLSM